MYFLATAKDRLISSGRFLASFLAGLMMVRFTGQIIIQIVMTDLIKEEVESSPELTAKGLSIADKRSEPDNVQIHLLSERIKNDHVVDTLVEIKRMMGQYSSNVDPGDIPVELVDGEWGSGEYSKGVLNVKLPSDNKVVELVTPFAKSLNIPDRDLDDVAREAANAALSSTVLHEATHVLIDSKPGSKMSADLEVGDPNGETDTMIDEGITYALQGIYAKEPYLVPDETRDEGRKEVRIRKKLGGRIRPRVKELLDNKGVVDKKFLKYCLETLREVEGEER